MNTSIKELESILDIYSLEDILEENDLTPIDALEFLLLEGFVTLPNVRPVDVSDTQQWDEELDLNEEY